MIKRTIDVVLSFFLLLLCSPLFFLLSLLILFTSGRPLIFKQLRVGYNCKLFTIYKFRTMKPDSEHSGTGLFSYKSDTRITQVGHWLRLFSLDELPQLLNILKGDMSLVGPRPPVHYELGPIEDYPSDLKHRFTVLPGITGLAQLFGRNDNNWDEKLQLDLRYISLLRRYGFLVDLFIIVSTFFSLLFPRNTIENPNFSESCGPITRLAHKHSTPHS